MAEGISLLGLIFGTLTCTGVFDCNRDFDSSVGIVLYFLICIYMFKQLGTICDEYFVPSLEVIVEKLEMSNDVAGATFMAAGSSAPELFTSLVATFFIVNEGGVGTIVGSAIFNILVIVGATGFCACKEQALDIWWYPLTRDSIFYVISITELMVFLSDDEIMWYESVIMVLTYFLYIFYMYLNPSIISYFGWALEEEEEEESPFDADFAEAEERRPSKDSKLSATKEAWTDPVTEVNICQETSVDMPVKSVSKQSVLFSGEVEVTEFCAEKEDPVVAKVVVGDLPNLVQDEGGTTDQQVSAGADDSAPKPMLVRSKTTESTVARRKEQAKVRMSMRGCAQEAPKLVPLAIIPTADGAEENGEGQKLRPPENTASAVPSAGSTANPESDVAVDSSGPGRGALWFLRDPCSLALEILMPTPQKHWLLFSLSILCIGGSTYVMVDAVNRAGTILKVPPMVMGLTVLAAGTSIPDAMGSIAVAKQGEGDMAVANALGSNIFDILVGLGVPWTIRCAMGKRVLFPDKFHKMHGDIIILASVLLLFVGSLLLNRWRLTRRVGIVLICFYFANVVYNILAVYVFKTKAADDT